MANNWNCVKNCGFSSFLILFSWKTTFFSLLKVFNPSPSPSYLAEINLAANTAQFKFSFLCLLTIDCHWADQSFALWECPVKKFLCYIHVGRFASVSHKILHIFEIKNSLT